jgi:hypothetical protein
VKSLFIFNAVVYVFLMLFAGCVTPDPEPPCSCSHPFGTRPEVPQLWKNGELVENHGESEEYRKED